MKKQLQASSLKFLSYLKGFVKNKPYLTAILFFVCALHLFGIIYSQIHPSPPLNPNRKKLIVKTMILPPDQSKPTLVTKDTKEKLLQVAASATTATITKTKKTLPVAKKKITTTTTAANKKLDTKTTLPDSKTKKLLSDLQESIAKIEVNRDNSLPAKTIVVPRPISELKADAYEIKSDPMEEEGVFYRDILINYLKDSLHLPGYGTVKIKLTLEHQGNVQNLTIVTSDSEVNRLYLEKTLQELDFPPFIGELSSKKCYTFSLTFCSDQ